MSAVTISDPNESSAARRAIGGSNRSNTRISNPAVYSGLREYLMGTGKYKAGDIDKELSKMVALEQGPEAVSSGLVTSDAAITAAGGIGTPGVIERFQNVNIEDAELGETERKFAMGLTGAKKALSSLEKGEVSTGPWDTRMQRLGEARGETKGTAFRAQLALAQTAIKSGFLGAGQSGKEIEGLVDALGNPNLQENTLKVKLQEAVDILEAQLPASVVKKANAAAQTGSTTGKTEGGVDRSKYGEEIGGIALPIASTSEEEVATLAAGDKKGFQASDLLPIAGSVVGGLAGGLVSSPSIVGVPAGVIAGGAAGGAIGEVARQNVENEDANVLAVAREAALGGAGGPIGKGVSRVAGMVASKTIAPAAKVAVKVAGRITGLAPQELIQNAIPIKPAVIQQASRHGVQVWKELLDEGISGSRAEMADQIETSITKNSQFLKEGLQKAADKGVTVDAKDIAKLLDPIKERLGKVAIPENLKQPIIDQVSAQQDELVKLGRISPVDAQFQKQAFDEFINFTVKDPKLAQQILQTTRGGFKNLIENNVKDVAVKKVNTRLSALIDAAEALKDVGERELNIGLREVFGLPSSIAAGTFVGGPVGGLIGGTASITNTLARSLPEFASKTAVLGHRIGQKVGGARLPEPVIEALRQAVGQESVRAPF